MTIGLPNWSVWYLIVELIFGACGLKRVRILVGALIVAGTSGVYWIILGSLKASHCFILLGIG